MREGKKADRIRESKSKRKGTGKQADIKNQRKTGRKGIPKQENRQRIRQWRTTEDERGKEGRQDQRKAKSVYI